MLLSMWTSVSRVWHAAEVMWTNVTRVWDAVIVWTSVTRVWDAVIDIVEQREFIPKAGQLRLTGSQMGELTRYQMGELTVLELLAVVASRNNDHSSA